MTAKPRKAYFATPKHEAWWYYFRGSIEIYIRPLPNGPTCFATITARQLRSLGLPKVEP